MFYLQYTYLYIGYTLTVHLSFCQTCTQSINPTHKNTSRAVDDISKNENVSWTVWLSKSNWKQRDMTWVNILQLKYVNG